MTTAEGAHDQPPGRLVLVRHGETGWSRAQRHTGRTDVPLTAAGEVAAGRLAAPLREFGFGLVLTSPLQRASHTAELAGLSAVEDPDLVEWDYGAYEGMTSAEVAHTRGPGWTVFAGGVLPGGTPGESLPDVAARAERVLRRARPVLATADVLLVGHAHALRVLAAVFLRQPPRFAESLLLSPATISVLAWEHAVPAVRTWNVRP